MLNKIIDRIRNKEFEVDITLYPNREKSFSDMNVLQREKYQKSRQALRIAEEQKKQDFRKALAETYELTDHPKEEILFNLAWETGHSSGYNDVALYYDEMSALIKD